MDGPGTVQPAESTTREATVTDLSNSRLTTTTLMIPRLVSVVEIIKREYLRSRRAPALQTGLHQYNEVGDLAETESTSVMENGALREGKTRYLRRR
jgi:hypothetical protein